MRRFTMVGVFLLLLAGQAWAQERIAIQYDRSNLADCPPDLLKNPGHVKVWGRLHAGVSPMMPLIIGRPEMINKFATGLTEAERQAMNPSELAEFDREQQIFNQALAIQLFTPQGTPESQSARKTPAEFEEDFKLATSGANLETIKLACGDVINGNSWGRLDVQPGQIPVVVDPELAMIGFYQRGEYVVRGGLRLPAIKAYISAPVNIKSGPNEGNTVRVIFLDVCGNITLQIRVPEIPEVQVAAPMPQTPVTTTTASAPPPAPPAQTFWVSAEKQWWIADKQVESVGDVSFEIRNVDTKKEVAEFRINKGASRAEPFKLGSGSYLVTETKHPKHWEPANKGFTQGFTLDANGRLLNEEGIPIDMLRFTNYREAVEEKAAGGGAWIPCVSGKGNKWACAGIAALPFIWWHPWAGTASTPLKVDPGGRVSPL